MTRHIAAFLGFIIFPCASAEAQTKLPPDFSGWTIDGLSRIELRVSDCSSVYLGLERNYKNPADPTEFGKMISRHIPLPISKCRKRDERSALETGNDLYARKEEDERLKESSEKSDPILYIHWRMVKDPSSGRERLDGDIEVWLMPPEGPLADGGLPYFKNAEISTEFLTENVGNGEPRNVFSGREYRVDGVYHLMRISRDAIMQLLERRQ